MDFSGTKTYYSSRLYVSNDSSSFHVRFSLVSYFLRETVANESTTIVYISFWQGCDLQVGNVVNIKIVVRMQTI